MGLLETAGMPKYRQILDPGFFVPKIRQETKRAFLQQHEGCSLTQSDGMNH